MIHSIAADVECFSNMFSITFVDMRDYLSKFADCKGALTDTLTVAQIKERLDSVKSWIFYISDTDDSQLLDIVNFIENMRPIPHDDGTVDRYDVFGYNNQSYDDMMEKEKKGLG